MPRVRRNDKRDRLVQSADQLIYEKTFHTTTLADIAKLADVPLGNVYYYFKTKEEIVLAVIKLRIQQLNQQFESWQQLPTVAERLKAFVTFFVEQAENVAQYGCRIGGLCQELGKLGGSMSEASAELMRLCLNWTQQQFEMLNKPAQESARLAEHFIANIEGMNLLTLTFKDAAFCQRQSQAITLWIDSLCQQVRASTSTPTTEAAVV